MSEYHYEFEQDDAYCYPGSFVLRNKLEIKDKERLEEAERNITAIRLLELKQNPPIGVKNFGYLKRLHKHIFGDIYIWAGMTRTVNISKGNMFCNCQFIDKMASEIFEELKKDNYLSGYDQEDFTLKLSYYLSEINALHPFREGNGRVQRLFIELLAAEAGYEVDFSGITEQQMISASAESFLQNYEKMNLIMKKVVTKAEE